MTQMKCSIKLQHCFRRLKQPGSESGSEIHHNLENSTKLKTMAMAETNCTVIYTPSRAKTISAKLSNYDWKLNTSQYHGFVCSFWLWYFLIILTIFNRWKSDKLDLSPRICECPSEIQENHDLGTRAATFTRVNGTVSCFGNKRLQNWSTVYTNFSTWSASWFINSIF